MMSILNMAALLGLLLLSAYVTWSIYVRMVEYRVRSEETLTDRLWRNVTVSLDKPTKIQTK